MRNPSLLNQEEVIEVVMKKNMTIKDYYELLKKLRKDGFKGWSIQGYEIGYYQGNKASIKVQESKE
ncbi:hypothetical protein ETU09_05890 [Apibacter muscae]|uniref:Uncharacterized protein n=1 Tax=Apibacter muscae TaxID=2509004 RepID=A0A563DFA9_9FLAO|nr:hypothetical protein [Apibacter muscae]TWP28454.1 hypothetical protein ETU09_05890 [Apibacter muscae]